MKRWWAWEWTLGMAGMAMPVIALPRLPPGVTAAIIPPASTVTVTSCCQPSAVSARGEVEFACFAWLRLYCIYNLIQVDFRMLLTNLKAATMRAAMA